ncbi:SET domain-containing protein [Phellopilus nigrolimitatus]|nr:SET domain-containing protein [Phellopilus nigrolimitatus]
MKKYRKAGSPGIVGRACRTPDCKRTVGIWSCYGDLDKAYPPENGWPLPVTPLPRPYTIKPTDSRGLGMFAVRNIALGETIVIERPVLLQPQINVCQNWEKLEEDLELMIKFLEPKDRKKLLALHNCKPPSECRPIAGILRTNAILCYFSKSKFCPDYAGVCLDTSRVNHSCIPNSVTSFDDKTLFVELRATRDISVGEEITITYVPELGSRADRQKELQSKYYFTCTCERCTAPGVEASDERRDFVRNAAPFAYPTWLMFSDSNDANMTKHWIASMHTLLDAAEAEGLYEARCVPVRWLACTYAALGDVENFKKWASETVRTVRVLNNYTTGFFSSKDWEKWLDEPTSMPFWGEKRPSQ